MASSDDLRSETIHLVRQIFQDAQVEPGDAAPSVTPQELKAARRRVNSLCGKGALLIALVPTIFSISPKLDAFSSLMFLMLGLTLVVIGTVYLDRATKDDRDLIRSR